MASAAIPIAFPPRRINDALYVDGAARQGLFLESIADYRGEPGHRKIEHESIQ